MMHDQGSDMGDGSTERYAVALHTSLKWTRNICRLIREGGMRSIEKTLQVCDTLSDHADLNPLEGRYGDHRGKIKSLSRGLDYIRKNLQGGPQHA
jgi:hypothetical protein